MRNNLFRDAALLVAAVLLTTSFWSCSKNEEPEPTPPAVTVTGVTLNKTDLMLEIGGSETLTATVAPADATNKNVTWKSSDATVATVDDNGKVTGVAAGEATITVTTEEGGKTATCRVTVSATSVAVTGVTLNKTELTLETGTVDATGKVTGVAIGEATITVTTEDGGKTATCKVAVKVPDIEGVYWFEEGMADELVPTVELFHKGQFYEYYYAKTDEAVAYLKKETGINNHSLKVGRDNLH